MNPESLEFKAIQLAAQCTHIGAEGISSFLYKYNTRPLTLKLNKAFSSAFNIEKMIDEKLALTTDWEKHEGKNGPLNYWLSWSKKTSTSLDTNPKYKIYLGITFEDLLEHLKTLSALLSKSPCHSFKIGRDLPNLLRPDHFVCYFTTQEEALATCEKLLPLTNKKVATHYVPFTSPLPNQHIISWGIDHPIEDNQNSWRQWVCNMLANLLTALHDEQKELFKDPLALSECLSAKLLSSGIDSTRWALVDELIH